VNAVLDRIRRTSGERREVRATCELPSADLSIEGEKERERAREREREREREGPGPGRPNRRVIDALACFHLPGLSVAVLLIVRECVLIEYNVTSVALDGDGVVQATSARPG